jgi:hypothetical protein
MSPLAKKAEHAQDRIAFHPFANAFPLLVGAAFREVVEDIKAHGLREPITLFQGQILEGRNRYRACLNAKVGPRYEQFEGDEAAARAFVFSKNIVRRHLKAKDKREAIAALLKANPNQSDRQIAEMIKASPTVVGKVRAEKEATGDVSTVDTRTDTRGRKQPTKRKRGATGTPRADNRTARAHLRALDEEALARKSAGPAAKYVPLPPQPGSTEGRPRPLSGMEIEAACLKIESDAANIVKMLRKNLNALDEIIDQLDPESINDLVEDHRKINDALREVINKFGKQRFAVVQGGAGMAVRTVAEESVAPADEELALLREFARLVVCRAQTVSFVPEDNAKWKALRGKVKALPGIAS